ncbi:serine hydrolase domain-containing protein [Portibacter marinus]|uniref:serine hydrolase domain-containing protein n=1 Tax=Portibacter marinus TaxID=2898660 RepID=UPI001F43BCFA|nr:serine hydrolase domain-containing protein [Portibacter marinus]
MYRIAFIFSTCLWLWSLQSCYQGSTITPEKIVNAKPAVQLQYQDFTELENAIDSIFSASQLANDFPGVGISIVLGNHIVYEKTFGFSNFKDKTSLDGQSIFRIGSLSKSFTSTLFAILEQQDKVSYHEPLNRYLPDLQLQNDSFASAITVGHLLSHTGGFPYHSYTNLVEDGLPISRIIKQFNKIDNLKEPGSIYSYQNAAFAVSGKLLERKFDASIQSLFAEKMFTPLCMNSTSTEYRNIAKDPNVALPHKKKGNGWYPVRINRKYYNAVPAGGINTTTEDMSRFLGLMLGNFDALLDKENVERLVCPVIETKVSHRYYKKWPGFEDTYYSYGWRVHQFSSEDTDEIRTLYHHGGMVNDYRSEMAFSLKEDFAVAVLFNGQSPLAKNIIPMIVEKIRRYKKSPLLVEENS